MDLPYVTGDLPGTGGVLRSRDEDFVVEEEPAYEPTGQGDHVFAWIEKRDLTTPMAAEALARALGVAARDIGWAGMKDRRAVTRQWLSLPPPVTPEAALAATAPGLTVLAARRHPHKLRTGHLRGNRFVLRVAGVGDPAIAAARATAVLRRLAEPPGAPNWFGEQRFGREGDNAEAGRRLLRGEGSRRGGQRLQRLYVSALQSELFNEWLRRRITDGVFRTVLAGDVLQKRASGGIFATTDPTVDQARIASGEIVVTGPMFGHALRAATPGTPAAAREAEVLDWAGLTCDDFRRVGAIGEGTRRASAIAITSPDARALATDAIDVSFTLPAGAYATAVMREILKTDAADAAADGAQDPQPD